MSETKKDLTDVATGKLAEKPVLDEKLESAVAGTESPDSAAPVEAEIDDRTPEEIAAEAERVLKELDRDSNTRIFTGARSMIITGLLIAFALYALWMNTVGQLPEQIRRASFVGFAVFIAFLLYPARKGEHKPDHIPWYDFALGIAGGGCFMYWVANYKEIVLRAGANTQTDIIVGIVGIVILLELCRRVVGIPIVVVVLCFILYAYLGYMIPGTFGHRGFSIKRIVAHLFYTTEGVIGTPTGVCSTFIVLFILFGSFIDKTGIGKFFIDIANSIAGWASGGPAKVAVIASGLQGMISGSSVANTVGSGSFTIPMMKKTGYSPEFAAAVEATASTGGQIMPPIMGAAAFLMAEMTGIGYPTIVTAAIIPAALYYAGVFLMIHFEAKKLGLRGLKKEEIPNFFKLVFTRGYLLVPLIVLVYLLMSGFTPASSACWAILAAIIASMFSKETRLTPKTFIEALVNGAKNTLSVAVACAVAGMIVGVVTLTGVGLKLASGLLALSGGNTLLALFFTMIACIILGMGVPTTANYVIMATITAPIVVQLGVPVLAAHMFVFYFGIVADITPPVALAAYAGSAIARSNPLKTGITATRLAITAFLVPYIFALSPNMLLVDSVASAEAGKIIFVPLMSLISIVFTSCVGMVGLAIGMEGYFLTRMSIVERLISVAGGVMLIIPETFTDILGVCCVGFVIAYQIVRKKQKKTAAAA